VGFPSRVKDRGIFRVLRKNSSLRLFERSVLNGLEVRDDILDARIRRLERAKG
jgi:hypothetical protein